jgi:hypothetical protein
MAGFDRNQVADINRNARPTSSESAYKPLIKQKYVKEKLEEETLAAVLVAPRRSRESGGRTGH